MHSCTFKEQQSETERDELREEQTRASRASQRACVGGGRDPTREKRRSLLPPSK